eukprot:gene13066-13193_t
MLRHSSLPSRSARACSTSQAVIPVNHYRVRCRSTPSNLAVRAASSDTASTSASSATSSAAASGKTFHHGITYVSYEGNSFYVKFNNSGARVLVDPWLVGDLQFFEQGWLYTGKKRGFGSGSGVNIDVQQVAADTDVILISQWVDDHTHMPTLMQLPKHVPIIAQPEAAERIKPLGFTTLTTISPGQTQQICGGKLQLTATAGSLVGPPWSARQNGYVLRVRLLVLGPFSMFSAEVPGGVGGRLYPLLKGSTDLTTLLKLLKPKVLVPLLNADLDQEGQLTSMMSVRGSSAAEDLRQALAAAGLSGTKLEYPAPAGESLALAL